VAQAVRDAGGVAEVALGDLADPAVAAALVGAAVASFGGLDALVANAGFADRTPIADLDDAAMARSVDAIQGGFFRLARAAMPHLKQGRDPRVVAVSSFVAHAHRVGVPSFPASAAAKAGLEALVRALALMPAPMWPWTRRHPRSATSTSRWAGSACRRKLRRRSCSCCRGRRATSRGRPCMWMAGW
jgi:3-oxoacyl-[acyl-carrier protein] reductase